MKQLIFIITLLSLSLYAGNDFKTVGTDEVQTLTNKTIDASSNTLSNIADASIKTAAAIDATKIGLGTVTTAEFDYLGDVTSPVQEQLNKRLLMDEGVLSDLIFKVSTTLTLSSDTLYPVDSLHYVNAESGQADNLATINGSTTGRLIVIAPGPTSAPITIKHNTSNIKTSTGTDMLLTGPMTVICMGSYWQVLSGGRPLPYRADFLQAAWGGTSPNYTYSITHSLGSTSVLVAVYDTTGLLKTPAVQINSENAITLTTSTKFDGYCVVTASGANVLPNQTLALPIDGASDNENDALRTHIVVASDAAFTTIVMEKFAAATTVTASGVTGTSSSGWCIFNGSVWASLAETGFTSTLYNQPIVYEFTSGTIVPGKTYYVRYRFWDGTSFSVYKGKVMRW